jgi:hypothetical protein
MHFLLARSFQRTCPNLRLCVTFHDKMVSCFMVRSCYPLTQPSSWRTAPCWLWLLIQNICSYPAFLEAVSSIFSTKTYHTLVMDPHNMVTKLLVWCNILTVNTLLYAVCHLAQCVLFTSLQSPDTPHSVVQHITLPTSHSTVVHISICYMFFWIPI